MAQIWRWKTLKEIFINTDPDKRDRIINSALEEFSKNSFDKASTNNIVKNAGISKGLLYHYFDSKKSLYKHLQAFSVKIMVDAIVENLDWEDTDLFKRIKDIVLIKFKVCDKYPYLIEFGKNMYENKTIDEMKYIVEDYSPDIYSEVYNRNIDYTLFKDDIKIEKAVKITEWVMEKLGEDWIKYKVKSNAKYDYEELITEIDEYLNILRKAFYKGRA